MLPPQPWGVPEHLDTVQLLLDLVLAKKPHLETRKEQFSLAGRTANISFLFSFPLYAFLALSLACVDDTFTG